MLVSAVSMNGVIPAVKNSPKSNSNYASTAQSHDTFQKSEVGFGSKLSEVEIRVAFAKHGLIWHFAKDDAKKAGEKAARLGQNAARAEREALETSLKGKMTSSEIDLMRRIDAEEASEKAASKASGASSTDSDSSSDSGGTDDSFLRNLRDNWPY